MLYFIKFITIGLSGMQKFSKKNGIFVLGKNKTAFVESHCIKHHENMQIFDTMIKPLIYLDFFN